MIKEFLQDEEISKKVDKVELFKMALEENGFDNTGRIIFDDLERVEKNINDMQTEKEIQDNAQAIFNTGIQGGDQGFGIIDGQMGNPQGIPSQPII